MITGTLSIPPPPVTGRLYGPAGQELRQAQSTPPAPVTFAVLGLQGLQGPAIDIGALPPAP